MTICGAVCKRSFHLNGTTMIQRRTTTRRIAKAPVCGASWRESHAFVGTQRRTTDQRQEHFLATVPLAMGLEGVGFCSVIFDDHETPGTFIVDKNHALIESVERIAPPKPPVGPR